MATRYDPRGTRQSAHAVESGIQKGSSFDTNCHSEQIVFTWLSFSPFTPAETNGSQFSVSGIECTVKKCSCCILGSASTLSYVVTHLPATPGSPVTFWSYMKERYQIFEHFNPSCKHFSVAKYFLSNGISKGFYYALILLNILNTKLWTKFSSLSRAKLTRGTFYSLHQVFSFQQGNFCQI